MSPYDLLGIIYQENMFQSCSVNKVRQFKKNDAPAIFDHWARLNFDISGHIDGQNLKTSEIPGPSSE